MFCNKNYQQNFDEKLRHTNFLTMVTISLFYYCEKDDWNKFNEISVPGKQNFYRHLNVNDITDKDYMHTRRVCKEFEIKNLGECHDLYIQSDILLLVDVFENFRNMFLKKYEFDPVCFLATPGLSCQAIFKKTKVILDLLTDTNVLLMVEKVLEEEYVTLFICKR